VEQAEAPFGAGAVLQLVSLVMKSFFLSFTKQQKGVLQSPSSLPDYSFVVFTTKTATIIALQFSVELSMLGEWCRMLQSWQLRLTA